VRVLVIEDEGLFAHALCESLTAAGHEPVGPARSLDEALHLAKSERPHLALVDIGLEMPGDGVLLARMLHLAFGLRSVFVSGDREEAHRNSDLALGFLDKPVDADVVVRSLEAVSAVLRGEPCELPPQLTPFWPSLAPAQTDAARTA
jgi:DNA-binding NarL/FixJ family response regulator